MSDRQSTRDARAELVLAGHARPRATLRRRAGARRARLAGLVRLVVFLLLIFAAVWAGVRVANASGDSLAYEGQRYEVQAGDTLWSIAAGHYDGGADLRELVYDIQRHNHLSGALLQPGQEIVLPYRAGAGPAE